MGERPGPALRSGSPVQRKVQKIRTSGRLAPKAPAGNHSTAADLGNSGSESSPGQKIKMVSKRSLSFKEMWSPPGFHQAPSKT